MAEGYCESTLNCALIYGYSIQNDQLRINSGTFNGNDMPDEMKKVFPEVFKKTRDGQKINCESVRYGFFVTVTVSVCVVVYVCLCVCLYWRRHPKFSFFLCAISTFNF